MREASFSSTAVKATIEQSLISQPGSLNSSAIRTSFRLSPAPMTLPNRNLYLNPRLQRGDLGQSGGKRGEEAKRVMDILLRSKKRNPVLVGDSEPAAVMREVLGRIERGDLCERLKNVQVISIEREISSDKAEIPTKIKELVGLIEAKIEGSGVGGVIVNLGDLKWLVDGGVPPETGRAAVAEVAALVARFGVWLVGTATCETYLRCQVYHPPMEADWDLQAVPIASTPPLPGMLPRLGDSRVFSSSVESLNPLKNFSTTSTSLPWRARENLNPAWRMSCCPQCTENYEKELAKLVAEEYEKSSSEQNLEVAQPPLPRWLQDAKVLGQDNKSKEHSEIKDQEMKFKERSQELQKKWNDNCMHLHPSFHHNLRSERITPTTMSMTGLCNPKLLVRQPFQQKLQQTRNHRESVQLNSSQLSEQGGSPPGSPVRTELVLGHTTITKATTENTYKTTTENTHKDDQAKDLLGCISFEPQPKFSELQLDKFGKMTDVDSFKKLLKGLMEKVWWQQEAASTLATSVTRCKLGHGAQRGTGSRGDIWLLFTGPDRTGKKKMASALSGQIAGTPPIMISLGPRCDDGDSDVSSRGKTALDRIAEAVRRNPFSVIVLEDIERADMLVQGSIKRAVQRGRLADFYGREISLGNVIFILTSNWLPDDLNSSVRSHLLDEKKLKSNAKGAWQLRLSLGENGSKRRANWLLGGSDRPTRPRKEIGAGLSLDLNLVADSEDDRTDGSYNSSDLTVDCEDDHALEDRQFSITSVPVEIFKSMDDAIIFKPVEITSVRHEIENKIKDKFLAMVDERLSIEVEEEALDKILGGLWLGSTSLEEWAEKVLVPSFQQLKQVLPSAWTTVRLESVRNYSGSQIAGEWLPDKITVEVDGV
ncbi:hypothetical protein NMG60_11005770 [Bertholletia excelsa]